MNRERERKSKSEKWDIYDKNGNSFTLKWRFIYLFIYLFLEVEGFWSDWELTHPQPLSNKLAGESTKWQKGYWKLVIRTGRNRYLTSYIWVLGDEQMLLSRTRRLTCQGRHGGITYFLQLLSFTTVINVAIILLLLLFKEVPFLFALYLFHAMRSSHLFLHGTVFMPFSCCLSQTSCENTQSRTKDQMLEKFFLNCIFFTLFSCF